MLSRKLSLQEHLTAYCNAGFCLFPLSKKTKRPVFKDNLKKASNDFEQVWEWALEYPGCNWGLSLAKSGLWALDIDTRHGGMQVWQMLEAENPRFETLTQETGSGGLHFIFKTQKGDKF